jgi:hypothetical protein
MSNARKIIEAASPIEFLDGDKVNSALPGFLKRALLGCALVALPGIGMADDLPNPVLFVTQVPVPAGFATIGSAFANHLSSMQAAARGGDLWIRYPNGTQRNLTAEAGYGSTGFQGANAIAVRDPAVDFSGTKAIFSMVVGAPTTQYQYGTWYWQLYEITGFGSGQTPTITRVAGQPADTNNVEPAYASDGSIIFSSDRSRSGERHLYPQLDEYESTPTPSGLWKLNRTSGNVTLLEHAPSGSFHPSVDSFGRIIFTRWDHLQQDQQAEVPATYGTFNWSSEAANASTLPSADVFPEPRNDTTVSYGHRMNEFFPWMVNQDGTGEETLNHIGRHELDSYFSRSLKDDASLVDFSDSVPRTNPNDTRNWLQISEDPTTPGRYVAIDAPEFYTHSAGQIISITATPTTNAGDMAVTYVTPKSTRDFYDTTVPADFSGHYRNPLPLTNGQTIASWVAEPREAENDGTRDNPLPRYKFRLYKLTASGGYLHADATGALTAGAGISKAVTYYDPDVLVTYNGPLWELSPVEVHARAVPATTTQAAVQAPESLALAAAGVDITAFRNFLAQRGLGVFVSRNVTTRDAADKQQPFNLRVAGGGAQTTADGGHIYDIAYMQFMQGDQVRGLGGAADPNPGRRVLAQPMHDAAALQFMPPAPAGAPAGSVRIASDGSMAAIVPAQRALTWQSTTTDGTPVVRERYWITVQPGEVRACASCHGINHTDQANEAVPQNTPQALKDLAIYWRDHYDAVFKSGFE